MSLASIETFVRVAETGSLSATARALGVPTSTVSRRITRLEEELGETLLLRTARALRLTDAGAAVYQRCAGPLREIEEVARAVRDHDAEPAGELRLTAPPDIGNSEMFVRLLQGYRERWPRVLVSVELTERVVDLVGERFDVALRAHLAPLPDRTSLVARRIATMEGGLFASPAWVAAHGVVEHPSALAALPLVAHERAGGRRWTLRRGEEELTVPVHPQVRANDLHFVRRMLVLGAGVGLLPVLLAGPELVRVLPEWATPAGTLSLVWPAGRALAPRVRRFIDHVAEVAAGTTCKGEHG